MKTKEVVGVLVALAGIFLVGLVINWVLITKDYESKEEIIEKFQNENLQDEGKEYPLQPQHQQQQQQQQHQQHQQQQQNTQQQNTQPQEWMEEKQEEQEDVNNNQQNFQEGTEEGFYDPTGLIEGDFYKDLLDKGKCTGPHESGWVTMINGGISYLDGALGLAASLYESGTKYPLVIMSEGKVDKLFKSALSAFNVKYIETPTVTVDGQLRNYSGTHVQKMLVWSLTEYKKLILIDADVLVRKNMDHLFCLPELSAAPACCPSLWFNSGLVVLEPNKKVMEEILSMPDEKFYRVSDQKRLNVYFKDKWRPIPTDYNFQAYSAAMDHSGDWKTFNNNFGDERVHMYHWNVPRKPWKDSGEFSGVSGLNYEREWWVNWYKHHPERDDLEKRVKKLRQAKIESDRDGVLEEHYQYWDIKKGSNIVPTTKHLFPGTPLDVGQKITKFRFKHKKTKIFNIRLEQTSKPLPPGNYTFTVASWRHSAARSIQLDLIVLDARGKEILNKKFVLTGGMACELKYMGHKACDGSASDLIHTGNFQLSTTQKVKAIINLDHPKGSTPWPEVWILYKNILPVS